MTEVQQARARVREQARGASNAEAAIGALTEAVLLLGELVECAGAGNLAGLDELGKTTERALDGVNDTIEALRVTQEEQGKR